MPFRLLRIVLAVSLVLSSSVMAIEDETSLLRRLVKISSGSENVSGVNQVQNAVESELKKLGFKTQRIANSLGENRTAKLLVGTLPGTDPHYVTLITHTDTVFEPTSHFVGFTIDSDGDTAHGPGVADDKGGLVVALTGLAKYLKNHPPRYSLRLVVSPSEEIGTEGFLDPFKHYSQDSVMVLGFEPSVEGAIVDSRRGNRWYQIKVVGKEAHGSENTGINACHELAMKLVEIERLGDPDKNVTVSIGHIEGGKNKFNIVCGEASAKVDTRFADAASSESLHKKILQILIPPRLRTPDGKQSAVTTFEIADESPAFPSNEISKSFIKKYTQIIAAIEKRPVHARLSVGSADSNYFYREGLIIIDGLGPTGDHEHTREEIVSLASLKSRSQAFSQFLSYLDESQLNQVGK